MDDAWGCIILCIIVLALTVGTFIFFNSHVGIDTTQVEVLYVNEQRTMISQEYRYSMVIRIVGKEKMHRVVTFETEPHVYAVGDTLYAHRSCIGNWYIVK